MKLCKILKQIHCRYAYTCIYVAETTVLGYKIIESSSIQGIQEDDKSAMIGLSISWLSPDYILYGMIYDCLTQPGYCTCRSQLHMI